MRERERESRFSQSEVVLLSHLESNYEEHSFLLPQQNDVLVVFSVPVSLPQTM